MRGTGRGDAGNVTVGGGDQQVRTFILWDNDMEQVHCIVSTHPVFNTAVKGGNLSRGRRDERSSLSAEAELRESKCHYEYRIVHV